MIDHFGKIVGNRGDQQKPIRANDQSAKTLNMCFGW
jgi:hypothetical protein